MAQSLADALIAQNGHLEEIRCVGVDGKAAIEKEQRPASWSASLHAALSPTLCSLRSTNFDGQSMAAFVARIIRNPTPVKGSLT